MTIDQGLIKNIPIGIEKLKLLFKGKSFLY